MLPVANLYTYADSNDKTGYFLRGRSQNSGYYNLQTIPAANRLFAQMDYDPGRIPHTEGDSVPGELTWRMYQAGLLETDNPDSTLKTLSTDELKDTFEPSNEELSLSETDLNTIQSFIESYSGAGESHVNRLATLIKNSHASNSNSSNFDIDLSGAIEAERQSRQLNVANTSLDEITERIDELEADEDTPSQISVEEIMSYPSGPQSFTHFWNTPARIRRIWGTDILDTVSYSIQYGTENVKEVSFSISDFTVFDAPDGLGKAFAESFETADKPDVDYDYDVSMAEGYDPELISENEEFTLYLGDEPLMSHTVKINNGRILSWGVEVTNHEWSQELKLLAFRRASVLISAIANFFDVFEGYTLDSPISDFNELSLEYTMKEYDEETKEEMREVIEDHDPV